MLDMFIILHVKQYNEMRIEILQIKVDEWYFISTLVIDKYKKIAIT